MTRVLLAEDDTSISEPLSRALRREGYQVEITEDGPSTLGRALSDGIDLILLDIGLPDMSGYDVARELRAMPGMRDAVLVAITGFGRPEDIELSREAGFDDVVAKPFAIVELVDRVARLLAAGR